MFRQGFKKVHQLATWLISNPYIDYLILAFLSLVPFLPYRNLIINETNIIYDINPSLVFWRNTFLWDSASNLGAPDSYSVTIFNFYNFILRSLDINGSIVHVIWFFLLTFLAAMSMYYFVKVYFPKSNRLFRLLASIAFIYNLFFLRMLLLGSFLTLNYVVLPLLLGLIYKGLTMNRKIYIVYIALITTIFSNINLTIIAIDFIVCAIFVLYLLFTQQSLRLKNVLFFLSLVLILAFFLSFWWLMPQFAWFNNNTNINISLSAETPQSYDRYSSFLETIRLMGELGYYGNYKGVPYVHYAENYLTNPIFVFSTIIYPIIAVSGFLIKRIRKKTIFFLVLLCIFLFLAVGVYPLDHATVNAQIYQWFHNNIPYFSIFRNGFKSVAVISFVYSIMFALSVDSFFKFINKKI